MWTLQWYIFRELFKAMVLTTIGMTLVFTLGGGVANMIKGVSISSIELLELLGFMLPVATTLTLPVAALLSTTNVYGRLSADNEFVACRASGINIHRLLLSALVVAFGVGAFTFYFSNYVIPSFIREIDSKARKSADQYFYRKLERDKFIQIQDYAFHADSVQRVQGAHGSQKDYLRVTGAAFIELEGGDAVRFGTAPEAIIEFDKSERMPLVRALMKNVSVFDRIRLQYGRLSSQPFGPMVVPIPSKLKAKWLNLPDLLRYRDAPEKLPEIVDGYKSLRRHIRERVCYDGVIRSLAEGKDWQAGDEKVRYTLKADPNSAFRRNREDGRPLLKDTTIIEETAEGQRILRAGGGSVRTTRSIGMSVPLVSIALRDGVTIEREGEPTIQKLKLQLRSVPMPDRSVREADGYADALIENPDADIALGERISDRRESLRGELGQQQRVIVGIIHARTAFSVSCIVLIVLGAALGIVFRGGQALASFGLSCVPFALVLVTVIMGRQMAQNEGTELVGLVILWTGIALVIVADGLLLFKWLRR